jgi:hypothetical protein
MLRREMGFITSAPSSKQLGRDDRTSKPSTGNLHSALQWAKISVAKPGRCKRSKFIWGCPGGRLCELAPVCAFLLHNALQWVAATQIACLNQSRTASVEKAAVADSWKTLRIAALAIAIAATATQARTKLRIFNLLRFNRFERRDR